ncbi:MAG: DUF4433 domain-containing protein [Dermatophilaceae bacterium]
MTFGILSHRRAAAVRHASVADEDVQGRRRSKSVPGGRPLHDYVNLYFDARNPMMFRRKGQREELAVLRISPGVLDAPNAVIADGNAASSGTRFMPAPGGLQELDASRVYAEFWTDPDLWTYYEKKRERCAELLVPNVVESTYVIGAYVCAAAAVVQCQRAMAQARVEVKPHVFFH